MPEKSWKEHDLYKIYYEQGVTISVCFREWNGTRKRKEISFWIESEETISFPESTRFEC